jgi:hypothetical protein
MANTGIYDIQIFMHKITTFINNKSTSLKMAKQII